MKFVLIIALFLTALVVTFSLQNSQTVQVQFLAWYFEGALVLVLLLTFIIGIITMYLVSLPGRFSRRRTITDLKRQQADSHREAARLKNE